MNKLAITFRRWTASQRTLPDFIIVGAQKAGTSSLYYYMVQHPEITAGTHKEIHFFDHKYDRGLNCYRRHFPLDRNRTKLTGEGTPYYMAHPHAMRRIAQDIPEVKLIVILRNPVDRAISGYFHSLSRGSETRDIETAFREEASLMREELAKMMDDEFCRSRVHQQKSYVIRGHYSEQLSAMYELFPKENILILESNEFFAKTKDVTNKAFEFLGLEPFDLPQYESKNANKRQ